MATLNSLRFDGEKAGDGKWFPDPWGRGLRFLIASTHSERFRRAAQKALRDAGGDEAIDDDERQDIMLALTAEHLLLDVEGLENDDGSVLGYAPEMGAAWGKDPGLQHVIVWVLGKAGEIREFLGRTREAAGKP